MQALGLIPDAGLSFHTCQTLRRVLYQLGRLLSPLIQQHQEKSPGLWMTGVPEPVGVEVPKVLNIFAGVSRNSEARTGTEITGA